MLNTQRYHAVKEDLEAGMFQDREEEHDMREALREYEDYQEYCREVRAELEYARLMAHRLVPRHD